MVDFDEKVRNTLSKSKVKAFLGTRPSMKRSRKAVATGDVDLKSSLADHSNPLGDLGN